jgi:hypothetical protein
MSRPGRTQTGTIDPADAGRSAASWKGKFIRDAYERKLGLVHTVSEDTLGRFVLLARFPGEVTDRQIYLEPIPGSLEFVSPGHVKARYRPPTDEDREMIARLTGDSDE